MPKQRNQKLKQKNRKFVKREQDVLASLEKLSLPKIDDTPRAPINVSPAVMSTLEGIKKKTTKRKSIRNKHKQKAMIERALEKEDIFKEKVSRIEEKEKQKIVTKNAW